MLDIVQPLVGRMIFESVVVLGLGHGHQKIAMLWILEARRAARVRCNTSRLGSV